MPETIRIGTLELLGISTSVDVEESDRFRRISIQRRRLMFGDFKKVGEIHIYVDQVTTFQEMLDNAAWVMGRISEVGFDQASREWAQGRGEG